MFSFLKEPLLQFLIVGMMIFTVDKLLNSNSFSPLSINPTVLETFIEDFNVKHGRGPSTEELNAFKAKWASEEVLYQEGLALGLDKHDPIIRQQVIKNMQQIVTLRSANAKPTDNELQAFLKRHQQLYQSQEKYSFYIVNISQYQQPELLLNALQNGADITKTDALYLIENLRTPALITAKYGSELLEQLNAKQPLWFRYNQGQGSWLVKMVDYHPPVVPDFETIKPRLLADWKKSEKFALLNVEIEKLKKKYQLDDY